MTQSAHAPMSPPVRLSVPKADAGVRLDRWVSAQNLGLSRSRVQALIADGLLTLNGGPAGAAVRLKPGDRLEVRIPPPVPATPEPQAIALNVVYEDDALIVVDKPAGLVVHPGAGNPDRTLVNALIAHCGTSLSGIGGVMRPGIVHRLDKDTSGLMVAAKTDAAHAHLAAQFENRTVTRRYLGLTRGAPPSHRGRIEGAIGRSPANRKKMAVVARGGRPAVTEYQVLKRFPPQGPAVAALVACRLKTGRTHQIRVHLAHLGCPLIGDPLYGRGRTAVSKGIPEAVRTAVAGFPRQALHADTLGLHHPFRDEFLEFHSPVPADMARLIEIFEQM